MPTKLKAYTVSQAAGILDVSRQRVAIWCRQGRLPARLVMGPHGQQYWLIETNRLRRPKPLAPGALTRE